jgi:hypothetical protein
MGTVRSLSVTCVDVPSIYQEIHVRIGSVVVRLIDLPLCPLHLNVHCRTPSRWVDDVYILILMVVVYCVPHNQTTDMPYTMDFSPSIVPAQRKISVAPSVADYNYC